jgi:hypothetical protein
LSSAGTRTNVLSSCLTDYPQDTGCDSPTDTTEKTPNVTTHHTACSDTRDDDNDGLTDYPTTRAAAGRKIEVRDSPTLHGSHLDDVLGRRRQRDAEDPPERRRLQGPEGSQAEGRGQGDVHAAPRQDPGSSVRTLALARR